MDYTEEEKEAYCKMFTDEDLTSINVNSNKFLKYLMYNAMTTTPKFSAFGVRKRSRLERLVTMFKISESDKCNFAHIAWLKYRTTDANAINKYPNNGVARSRLEKFGNIDLIMDYYSDFYKECQKVFERLINDTNTFCTLMIIPCNHYKYGFCICKVDLPNAACNFVVLPCRIPGINKIFRRIHREMCKNIPKSDIWKVDAFASVYYSTN